MKILHSFKLVSFTITQSQTKLKCKDMSILMLLLNKVLNDKRCISFFFSSVIIVIIVLKILFWTFYFYVRAQRLRQASTARHFIIVGTRPVARGQSHLYNVSRPALP